MAHSVWNPGAWVILDEGIRKKILLRELTKPSATWADSLCLPLLQISQFVFDPPFVSSSLPSYLSSLPRRSLSASQHILPGWEGAFDPANLPLCLFSPSPCCVSPLAVCSDDSPLSYKRSPLLTVRSEFKDDILRLHSGLSVWSCCRGKV